MKFKKKLRSDYIINFKKNPILKKYELITSSILKNNLSRFLQVGGPWVSPLMKQKLFRKKFMKSFTA
jgi:hypothetical protein